MQATDRTQIANEVQYDLKTSSDLDCRTDKKNDHNELSKRINSRTATTTKNVSRTKPFWTVISIKTNEQFCCIYERNLFPRDNVHLFIVQFLNTGRFIRRFVEEQISLS